MFCRTEPTTSVISPRNTCVHIYKLGMLEIPSIPLSLLRDLRCRQCENFVTCGPVFVVPDGTILCGRCEHLAKNIYQNTSYEALASIFLYPCQNWEDHCPTSLRWNESLQHEEKCSFSGSCNLFWKHPKAYWKGKREIPMGDIRLIGIPEYLLDYIKCSQCESYLSCEPVYIQMNGRNICHRCVYANGVPPDSVRNISYEILSNIIVFPCEYRNRGCPTRLKFGSDLWHHESQCSYNQMFRKAQPKYPNQKEKGIIRTHSGHVYGTITPNTLPFISPSPTNEMDINAQLVKSLKKQQGRRILRIEDIETSISRMNSEDGSLTDLDESLRVNSYEKNVSSRRSTPTEIDEVNNRQKQTESAQIQRDSGYYSHISTNNNSGNYQQNIALAQVHRENESPTKEIRQNAYNKGNITSSVFFHENEKEDFYKKARDSFIRTKSPASPKIDYNGVKRISSPKVPCQNIDFNILAGHYPVFAAHYENVQLQYSPCIKNGGNLLPKPALLRSDSVLDNRGLMMEELKQKHQNRIMRNTIQEDEGDSPYKKCHNLEDVLQTHDKINKILIEKYVLYVFGVNY
ncbi:hypothetical protein JTB14_021845 [Gonioctena quinquepunctata]|nr:hypothetical protein JTB14_021845 [Gonioctena quinquepunctata]